MITTIISDLSEVYLHGLWGVEERLHDKYGIVVDNKALYEDLKAFELFHHGEITEEQFWQSAIDTLQWSVSVDDLKATVRENFQEIEGTRDIYEQLAANGYKLGLLSVHTKEWIEYCEKQFDYHKLFDAIVYSYEYGVSKPEKRAYELILEKLDADPKECLFFDDIKKNIDAASELGITAIQFTSADQLKHDLRKAGIRLERPFFSLKDVFNLFPFAQASEPTNQ